MRLSRNLLLAAALPAATAHALSIDGDTQLHVAVGQPLSVSVPVKFSGDEQSRIYYRLTPAAGLAEAEERAAESVHASFDPAGPAIVLSTVGRVTVPAMRLHLEVGAGSVVVSRDLTILSNIPDLDKSSPLEAAPTVQRPALKGDAMAPPVPASAPSGAQGIAIGQEADGKTAVAYGDAASGAHAASAPGQAQPQPRTELAPPQRYFNTYPVKKGETLASIAAHLSRAGAGNVDAIMLAVYEANIDNFPPRDPQHPIAGHLLGIPDAPSISTEPKYRVEEFKQYLRKPAGEWQVPVTLLTRKADPVQEQPQASFWEQHGRTIIGAAALVLVLWGLSKLFSTGRHKREMTARRTLLSGGAPMTPPAMSGPAPDTLRETAREAVVLVPPPPENEQAEISRLRELLAQQPARADLRLRLAQRLFEARRPGGFAEVALPLEHVLSADAWERVRIMGHDLLPFDFRFQPPAGEAAMAQMPDAPRPVAAQNVAAGATAATIDFDFHGEMARVDKTRTDLFGGGNKSG